MKCPTCKGKMGKVVSVRLPATRYAAACRIKRLEPCQNCNGTGAVSDGQNNTTFSPEYIYTLPLLLNICNNWRRRNIFVYQHPTLEDKVISVGKPLAGGGDVICLEDKSDWPQLSSYEYQHGRRFFVTN